MASTHSVKPHTVVKVLLVMLCVLTTAYIANLPFIGEPTQDTSFVVKVYPSANATTAERVVHVSDHQVHQQIMKWVKSNNNCYWWVRAPFKLVPMVRIEYEGGTAIIRDNVIGFNSTATCTRTATQEDIEFLKYCTEIVIDK